MALYLGGEKLAPSNVTRIETSSPTGNYKAGTVTADENGVVTFPELDFTPTMITLWSVEKVDLKAEVEARGEDWEEGWTQYVYKGFLLMAIYEDDTWISQGLGNNSGDTHISNASFSFGSTVSIENGRYMYRLHREGFNDSFEGVVCNYAIYG